MDAIRAVKQKFPENTSSGGQRGTAEGARDLISLGVTA